MAKKEVKVKKIVKVKTPPSKKRVPKKIVSEKVFSKKTIPQNITPKITSPRIEEVVRTSPKDVFLQLLMLVMLYLGVISLITLAFAYIEHSFPDPLSYYYGSGLLSDIRWQSSMLIVSFPLLLILSHFVQKSFRTMPKKHELKFYKWLTYLTLFVAAITIVIYLIQLVNRFYGGELTTSFVLKVLSVLLIAGAVFGYYIWEVQSQSYQSKVPSRVGSGASVLVVGMLALGFILAGSPAYQRQVRFDEERVSHLLTIQDQVTSYWQTKRELPPALKDLENDMNYFHVPQDPESFKAYEYKIISPLTFELCAEFNLKKTVNKNDYDYQYYDKSSIFSHEAGRSCFERTIDPELYPKSQPYVEPEVEASAQPE